MNKRQRKKKYKKFISEVKQQQQYKQLCKDLASFHNIPFEAYNIRHDVETIKKYGIIIKEIDR